MNFKQNYYTILEVNDTATREEIRATFRRLAKIYHPDKNSNNSEFEEKFKLINEAHEVLSNEILRHEYDQYRRQQEEWKKQQEQQGGEEKPTAANQRVFQKKRTVTTEKRIYVKGKIIVKYWG